MDVLEERIRQRAYKLWEEEGRPDGRSEIHWVQAKEIVAIEDGQAETLKPVNDEAAESARLLENLGEFPTLTDQGEMESPRR